MKNIRQVGYPWIFRLLVVIGCSLMIVSFALPWWQASSIEISSYSYNGTLTDAISIYGFGLRHRMAQLASYLTKDVTPVYQTVLAWSYTVLSLCLAMIATFLRGWKCSMLLALAGSGYVTYAVVTGYVITSRLTSFGFAARGHSNIAYAGAAISMQAGFSINYYLAFIAGGFLIMLAILYYLLRKTIEKDF